MAVTARTPQEQIVIDFFRILSTGEPEPIRAERIVASRGASVKTLRYLASRGYSEESVERLVADLESRALG